MNQFGERHEDHIVLYNFHNTDGILQTSNQFFHIESMPHTTHLLRQVSDLQE